MTSHGPADGDEIPGYTLGARLGRGGFAQVFRARQDRFDRDVAIKFIDADVDDPDERRRFENECRALGRLSTHPHIADVYDAGVSRLGRPYIVMKLYEGGSLGERLRREGPLPVPVALAMGRKVADALQAAHELGIIHRDVKPDNVLFDEKGEPALTDFGIATIADPDGNYTSSIAFSRAYAAPEVVDENRFSRGSDIYSLGATLYTAITGRPVFDAPTEGRLVVQILTADPSRLDVPGLPDAAADVIHGCLHKDPLLRPQSATEVGSSLAERPGNVVADPPAHGPALLDDPDVWAGEEAADPPQEDLTVARRPAAEKSPSAASAAEQDGPPEDLTTRHPSHATGLPAQPQSRRAGRSRRVALAALGLMLAIAIAVGLRTLLGSSDTDVAAAPSPTAEVFNGGRVNSATASCQVGWSWVSIRLRNFPPNRAVRTELWGNYPSWGTFPNTGRLVTVDGTGSYEGSVRNTNDKRYCAGDLVVYVVANGVRSPNYDF